MVLFRFGTAGLLLAVSVLSSGVEGMRAWAEAEPSAESVIQKAVSHAEQQPSGVGAPGYTYTRVSVTEQLDASGKIRERKEKVFEVSTHAGSTSARLVAVNGHPPRQADLKVQSDNEINVRQILGESKTASGTSQDNFLTPELVARFDFKLLGQTEVNGRPAYELAFEPRSPELPVHHIIDRLLNQLSGTLWIDAGEFEIARADIRLRSEVDLLGGVIGCLKKMVYSVTRMRLGDGVWVNSTSRGDFEGRKLLDSMRIKTQSRTTNVRPMG